MLGMKSLWSVSLILLFVATWHSSFLFRFSVSLFSSIFFGSSFLLNISLHIGIAEYPYITAIWLVFIDFIPNWWFLRTFTQVSVQWHDTDAMREELDDLQVFEYFPFTVYLVGWIYCIMYTVYLVFLMYFWLFILFVFPSFLSTANMLLGHWNNILINHSHFLTLTDFSKHKMGYLIKFARWDVPCEQVSNVNHIYVWHFVYYHMSCNVKAKNDVLYKIICMCIFNMPLLFLLFFFL